MGVPTAIARRDIESDLGGADFSESSRLSRILRALTSASLHSGWAWLGLVYLRHYFALGLADSNKNQCCEEREGRLSLHF